MLKLKQINHKKIIKIELMILVVCLVIGAFRFVTIPSSVKEAITLATTRKQETFTELYFEDHINLPKTITRWNQYNFAFTVHNDEYQDVTYPYIVYLQRDDQKTIIDQGNFWLKNDEFKTVKISFGPLKNVRSEVVVELINKNQSIHFWMEAK